MQGNTCYVLLLTIAFCWGNGPENTSIYDATLRFSMELLQKILEQDSGNIVVSPVSVHAVLAMLQHGAGSNTKHQLDQIIHADENTTREGYSNVIGHYQCSGTYNEIDFASRMFLGIGFELLPEFKQLLVSDFQADIESLNFVDVQAAVQHINSWVADKTHNHITELFQPDKISADSVLVLVNAIFFKSYWDVPFMDVQTESFSLSPEEEIQVPTMHQRQLYPAGESSEMGVKWLHLTFNLVDDFTMLLVHPTERYGLGSLKQLTHEQWTSIFTNQDIKLVNVSIPKFKLEKETDLIPLLTSLGAEDMFGPAANFSGISNQHIEVSEFLQKATIGVDEKGVTAAAATGVVYYRTSRFYKRDPEEMEFKADQPFLIFIIHQPHGVPLFAGRVTNPLD